MNRISFASLFVFLLLTVETFAQPCTQPYTQKQFNVYREGNIIYGTDTNFNHTLQTLKLNIWKPIRDNNILRPLLLLVHGGGFVSGQKEDFDSLASWYAARGYVAATIQYRLLFYPPLLLTPPYAYDSTEVLRAGYRSIQDLRGAIRFMKNRSASDSSDINKVYVLGASAGAIAALGAAYIDQASEIPTGVDSIAAVIHGPTQYLRPSLGPLDGKLNLGNADASFHGVVAYMGAMLDTAHLESNLDMPLFVYHQTGDPIVGCTFKKGLHGAPLGLGTNYPHLYGSCLITPRAQQLGYSSAQLFSYIHNGSNHSVHNEMLIDSLTAHWLSALICPVSVGLSSATTKSATLEVFPIPADNHITIAIQQTTANQNELRVFNSLSQIIYETKGYHTTFKINTSSWPAGLYTIVVYNGSNYYVTKKSIIRH